MYPKNEAVALLDELGSSSTPFVFLCDFLGKKWIIETLPLSVDATIKYNFHNTSQRASNQLPSFHIESYPISFDTFSKNLNRVKGEINYGNSFLTNLTFKTPIHLNADLDTLFCATKAKYKILIGDSFLVFSPETFIRIEGDSIFSNPMKGTIDAAIPDALQHILSDPKEQAEHHTIVDLIRNDLSSVARDVHVTRFRYAEKIKAQERTLIQISSEIAGALPSQWKKEIGTIISNLLPAGSVSGAPKIQTLRIIQQCEEEPRGFYTGVCGVFDGTNFDSCVMIRCIEKNNHQYYYRSGGGITALSDAEKEYAEMINKIYLPI